MEGRNKHLCHCPNFARRGMEYYLCFSSLLDNSLRAKLQPGRRLPQWTALEDYEHNFGISTWCPVHKHAGAWLVVGSSSMDDCMYEACLN